MTISEQLREAALFDSKLISWNSVESRIVTAFMERNEDCKVGSIHDRTFLLLVAEALE